MTKRKYNEVHRGEEKMINCNITTNYFIERQRMTQKGKFCEMCYKEQQCPLCAKNNGIGITCVELESSYPEKAISIVQWWSNAHPQRTCLTELLKKFPNTLLKDDGIPKHLCPYHLGLMNRYDCRKYHNCAECWNQPLPEREEVKVNESL